MKKRSAQPLAMAFSCFWVMKTLKFILAFFTLTTLAFSCKNEEIETYSCNTTQDKWVKAHLNEIKNFKSRMDFVKKIPTEHFVASFRALTPQQKFDMWTEKFQILIENASSEKERKHLKQAIGSLTVDFFKKINNSDAFEIAWNKFAIEELKWSREKVHILTNTLYLEDEFWRYTALYKNKLGTRSGEEATVVVADCGCRYSMSCLPQEECKDGNCNEAGGCGFWGNSKCTGKCKL